MIEKNARQKQQVGLDGHYFIPILPYLALKCRGIKSGRDKGNNETSVIELQCIFKRLINVLIGPLHEHTYLLVLKFNV